MRIHHSIKNLPYSQDTKQRTEDGNLKNLHAVSEATRVAADYIAEHLRKNRFCINIGGDHSLAIG